MSSSVFRTKSVQAINEKLEGEGHKLAKRLNAFDLTMIGIGGIIGAGIFVLTGTAAATKAGPAVVVAFMLSALGCALAGLCYAELASMLPVAGSAYTYAYATLGELVAWIIGWDLVLEYAVGSVTVAIGWSGYLNEFLEGYGVHLPQNWTHGYFDGGILNVPAMLLVAAVTTLLVVGVKESARMTAALVVVKLVVVGLFLVLGTPHVQPSNWKPFMPFGLLGILGGAGVIFFAYIGFDAVTTTSEETKNPQRDIPIGIFASLAICTLLYIAVALVLTGIVPYKQLDHSAPVALALGKAGIQWGMQLVSVGAVVGLGSVVMVLMTGQPRILFAMSRDGLISPWISKVHPKYHTPYRSTILTGVFVAIFAGILPVGVAGEMTSIGTLFAFVLVCLGVIVLRAKHPEIHRSFRAPWNPVIPAFGALVCFAMMCGLGWHTWVRFLAWLAIGMVLYFAYGKDHARLATPNTSPSVGPSPSAPSPELP